MAAAAALITTFDAMLSCDMVEWSSLRTKVGRKELPDREKMKGTNLATKSAAKHFSENFFLTCTQKRWQRNCWGCEMLCDFVMAIKKRSTHFLIEQSLSFHPSSSSSLSLIPALSDYRIDCCRRQTLTHSQHSPNPRSKSNRNLIKRKRCAQWAVVVVVVVEYLNSINRHCHCRTLSTEQLTARHTASALFDRCRSSEGGWKLLLLLLLKLSLMAF